jgi:hypothetical protein
MVYLAAAYLELGHLTQAETLLTSALGSSRALNMSQNSALCHLYFGQLHLLRGEKQAVLEQWRQALAILHAVHTPLVEQRVLLIYLPWLLRIGEWRMALRVARQLFQTMLQQRLGPRAFWRLLCHFSLRNSIASRTIFGRMAGVDPET